MITTEQLRTGKLQINDRLSAIIKIAGLLFQCKCEIYGGFIRDWIIDNKEPNDIDFLAKNGSHIKSFINHLALFAKENGIEMTVCPIESVSCGKRVQIKFESRKFTNLIKCDAIILEKSPEVCDADVNNLLLNEKGRLVQKIKHQSYTVEESISNIQQKKFNFFQGWEEDANYSTARVLKLLNKNYRCNYGVPADKLNLFPPILLPLIQCRK